MKYFYIGLLCTALLLCLYGGNDPENAKSEKDFPDELPPGHILFKPYIHHEEIETLDKKIVSLLEDYQVAGLSASFVRGDEILWSGNFGWFDLENMIPLHKHHLIRIASISKTVACLAAMQLAAEEKLDIDEDINTYLRHINTFIRHPDYPDTPITVRQLMNHTSAIANGNYVPFVVAARREDPPPTLDDYFSEEGRFKEPIIWSDFEPGKEFEYSNMATIVLGAVIESITGRMFADYVEETLFAPLDMKQSTFHIDAANLASIGTMYRRINADPVYFTRTEPGALPVWKNYIPGTHGGLHSPQGGMLSNAHELALLSIMMMNNGKYEGERIFSPVILELMHDVTVETDKTGSATFGGLYRKKGLGIHITERLLEGYSMYGHLGGAYGISTIMYYTRDQDPNFGVILLINGANTTVRGRMNAFSLLKEQLAEILYSHFMYKTISDNHDSCK